MIERVRETMAQFTKKNHGMIALEAERSERDVLRELGPEAVEEFAAGNFDKIMQAVTFWGDVIFIVQNESVTAEVKGMVPPGSSDKGYYNFAHGMSPIGGHIRKDEIDTIFFVNKPVMGMEALSIQFFNKQGHVIFKIYLARDANRQILREQREQYECLKERLCEEKIRLESGSIKTELKL